MYIYIWFIFRFYPVERYHCQRHSWQPSARTALHGRQSSRAEWISRLGGLAGLALVHRMDPAGNAFLMDGCFCQTTETVLKDISGPCFLLTEAGHCLRSMTVYTLSTRTYNEQ